MRQRILTLDEYMQENPDDCEDIKEQLLLAEAGRARGSFMLDSSYFDGSREIEIDDLVREIEMTLALEMKSDYVPEVELPVQVMEMVSKMGIDPSYLLPYRSDVIRCDDCPSTYEYYYQVPPGGQIGFSYYDYPKSEMSRGDVGLFHSILIRDKNPDAYIHQRDMRLQRYSREIPYPPYQLDDGQLKIVTDLLILMDSVEKLDNLRILVIGSSSPNQATGQAYVFLLHYMRKGGTVNLYDPNENQRKLIAKSYVDGSDIIFNYYAREFVYKDLEFEKYDIIFDDSWVPQQTRSVRDPYLMVYRADHFSIKAFPYERVPTFHEINKHCYVYKQRFKTKGFEVRHVSYKPEYKFVNNDLVLGFCPGCNEIRGRMRYLTDKICVDYIRAHKRGIKSCKTLIKEYKDESLLMRKVESSKRDFSEYFTLPENPYSASLGAKVVHLPTEMSFEGKKILLDYNSFSLSYLIYKSALNVVLYREDSIKEKFLVKHLDVDFMEDTIQIHASVENSYMARSDYIRYEPKTRESKMELSVRLKDAIDDRSQKFKKTFYDMKEEAAEEDMQAPMDTSKPILKKFDLNDNG